MRHRTWMSTAAYFAGLLGLASLPWREGWTDYLPGLLAIYLAGGLTISVGYHRLFCHGVFQAHGFWHWLFAAIGVMYVYGSPTQWDVTHAAHHTHSDTERDPHYSGLRSMFSKAYRDVPLDLWRTRRLMRQHRRLHAVVDGWYGVLLLAGLGALVLLTPDFALMAYLPALGLGHLTGSLHNALSHRRGAPRDLWFMELLAPAGGEWLHGTHHGKPGRVSFATRWFHIDPGALLIALIRKRGAA